METRSLLFRTWGAALLLILFLAGAYWWTPDWVSRIGSVLLSICIAWDAHRRASTEYLHPWLFFLLGLAGIGLMSNGGSTVLTTGMLIAAGVAILLVTPGTLQNEQPSRLHLLTAVLFAETLLLTSLLAGTPVLQAALAVVPVVALEQLITQPRTTWWRKAAPFGIVTLLLLVALMIRATYALP